MIVQIYYLYEFIYSIPMKKETPKMKKLHINALLRGQLNDNSREKHTQKHQPQPHLKHTNRDNNTALFYTLSTSLGVAYRS